MAGLIITDSFDFRAGAAPANPDPGAHRMYWKLDGYPYTRDSAGTERAFMLTTVPETNKVLLDNLAEAWAVVEGVAPGVVSRYLYFRTTDGGEQVVIGADPANLPASAFFARAGSGGWFGTSLGSMLLDAAASFEINSSGGIISIGNDAVNRNMAYGTAGVRTLLFGSATAIWSQTCRTVTITLGDDEASPYTIQEGANAYLRLVTTNNAEELIYGNDTTKQGHTFYGGDFDFSIGDDSPTALQIHEGANVYVLVDTSNGAELITFDIADLLVSTDLTISGITSADGLLQTKQGVPAGVDLQVGGTGYTNGTVSSAINNTDVQTAFDRSKAFPPGTFQERKRLVVRSHGTVVNTVGAGEGLTIRIVLRETAGASTVIATLDFAGGADPNELWILNYHGHVMVGGTAATRTLNGQTAYMNALVGGALSGSITVGTPVDTTKEITVEVTADWLNANILNSVRLDGIEIELE